MLFKFLEFFSQDFRGYSWNAFLDIRKAFITNTNRDDNG
ncbi:hypothetical protein FLA_0729 [Filimonas lacunae]|nr:hypothetical protein FLA_0729 [Filimonas lacunae]